MEGEAGWFPKPAAEGGDSSPEVAKPTELAAQAGAA